MSKRGFTMIEMMAVVSIVAILSSIAVINIRTMAVLGKVNGAATSLQRVLATARVRAMTTRCPMLVQINGPTYAYGGAVATMPTHANRVYVIVKGDCASTNGFFEDGDRVVSDIGFESKLTVQVPTTLIGAPGIITGESIVVGYPADQTLPKTVTIDTGAGVFNSQPTPALDFQFTGNVKDVVRHTYVPDQAPAYND